MTARGSRRHKSAPTEALIENDGVTRPREKFTLDTTFAPYCASRKFNGGSSPVTGNPLLYDPLQALQTRREIWERSHARAMLRTACAIGNPSLERSRSNAPASRNRPPQIGN